MTETVLFVDDEENILRALNRAFLDSDFQVLSASSGSEALDRINGESVAVVVSDNHMPGMTGVELLSTVKTRSPDTVRVLMTGQADLQTAIDAINRGEVFRFLVKPWDDEGLRHTVEDGVNRFRVIQGLRASDERTLLSLAQTVELKDRYTRGHCDRVASLALETARALGRTEDGFLTELKHGSWLHDCGKIGIPDAVLNKPGKLDEQEFQLIRQHPEWGAQVAMQAGLSPVITNVIRFHHERWDGLGYPQGLSGESIPLEARIVALGDVYDAVTTDRPYQQALLTDEARAIIESARGKAFDPGLTDLFLNRVVPADDRADH